MKLVEEYQMERILKRFKQEDLQEDVLLQKILIHQLIMTH